MRGNSYMNKWTKLSTITLAASLLLAPIAVNAAEIDDRIAAQEEKIAALENQGASAQAQLAAIQADVTAIENEVTAVLAEKTTAEERLTEINSQISELEVTIAQRTDQIEKQARDTQTNQNATSYIDIVLSAESLSDAVTKTMALTTLVSANNEIIQAQKTDKEQLSALQVEAEEHLVLITEKTSELQDKQDELLEARLNQEVEITALSAQLATEEDQKAALETEKAEAEARRQAELAALEEKRLQEEATAAALAAEAKANEEEPAVSNLGSNGQTSVETNSGGSTSNTTPPATNSSGWSAPLSSLNVTSPFGMRSDPFGGGGSSMHNGIDFTGYSGMPVMAAKAGEVVFASYESGGGNVVILKHSDGYYSYYMHLSSFATSTGSQVSAGQVIGGMGTTGASTGVHLHFGISTGFWSGYVNPSSFLGV